MYYIVITRLLSVKVLRRKQSNAGANRRRAKATQVKAKSDAKMKKTVKEATSDSIDDRITADYKVAIEKCDALAGDAKSACVSNAKISFKKS